MLLAVDPGDQLACVVMRKDFAIVMAELVPVGKGNDDEYTASQIVSVLRKAKALGATHIVVEAQFLNPTQSANPAAAYARNMRAMRLNEIASMVRSAALGLGLLQLTTRNADGDKVAVKPTGGQWRKHLPVRNHGKSKEVKDDTRNYIQRFWPHIEDQNLCDAAGMCLAYIGHLQ